MADAVNGQGIDVTIEAGADLSSLQYKAIALDGTIATGADAAIGILQNKPKTGEAAQVRILGKMMGRAGGTVAAKALLKLTTSGTLMAVASGDRTVCCGKNLNVSVASGDVFTFFGNFINHSVLLPSSY